MNKTVWTGDYDGQQTLGISTNMYYTGVEGELLYNKTQSIYGKLIDPADHFSIRFAGYVPGTLEIRINGIEYQIGSSTYNDLTILDAVPGYITADYLPLDQVYNRLALTSGNRITNTRIVVRPAHFQLDHINSLITAVHNIQRVALIPPTRFNISDTELCGFTFSLVAQSRIIRVLFDDLETALITLSAKYGLAEFTVMERFTTLSADMIQAFREWINYLEASI